MVTRMCAILSIYNRIGLPTLMPLARPTLLVVVLFFGCGQVSAEPDTACPLPRPRSAKPPTADRHAPIEARADNVRAEKGGIIDLEGSAELYQGGTRISADRLHYDKSTDTAEVQGNARIEGSAGDSFYTGQAR